MQVFNGTAPDEYEFSVDLDRGESSLFSMDYLQQFFSQLRKGDLQNSYKIDFWNEFPMKMRAEIFNRSHVLYMLAPRIEAD